MIRVAIRTNGGAQIGLGHVRRCLSLAEALMQLGVAVEFIVNADSVVRDLVRKQGFNVASVQSADDLKQTQATLDRWNSNVLVTDSYDFSSDYLGALSKQIKFMIAIDDLANQHLPVALVVNGDDNAPTLVYSALSDTQFLLGSAFMLLRSEFSQIPTPKNFERIERVLITVGGSDPWGLTPRLMRWLWQTLENIVIDVVVGPFFEDASAISTFAEQHPQHINIHCQPKDIRALMLSADLALSGGGQTTYELAATQTPAVAVCLAENQRKSLESLARDGTLIWGGDVSDHTLETQIKSALNMVATRPNLRQAMSWRGRQVVDGLGAMRVAQKIVDEYYRRNKEDYG